MARKGDVLLNKFRFLNIMLSPGGHKIIFVINRQSDTDIHFFPFLSFLFIKLQEEFTNGMPYQDKGGGREFQGFSCHLRKGRATVKEEGNSMLYFIYHH